MEKKYENGERVYLEVTVNEVNPGNGYDYTVLWKDHVDGAMCMASVGEENLCSMESGIDWQGTFNEYSEKAQRRIKALTKQLEEANETIKAFSESENIVRTNFTAKCDEIMALKSENERLSKQNGELGTTVDDLKKELAYSEDCRKAAEKKLDDSVDRITRLCKQRDVLTDYIIDLELKF